jgi:hypothetical protein
MQPPPHSPQPPPHSPQPQHKSGINKVGLFFIILGVIIFTLLVAGSLMVYSTIKDMGNMLEPTSRVTAYEPTEQERQALKKKEAALEKVQKQGGEYKMIITPSDINTYLSKTEQTEDHPMRPKIRVDIQGSVISGMISIPIKDDETGKLNYFNGEAKFTTSLNNGDLDVRLKDVLIRGKKPPFMINMVINQFKTLNLAEEINSQSKHKHLREQLLHCKKLEIKDGRATVILKFAKPIDATKTEPKKLKMP